MMPITTGTYRSGKASLQQTEIWGLLEEYADIRDELEDTLDSFRCLQADIELAMEEVTDELKLLQEHLNTCSGRLMRFGPSRSKQYEVIKEHEELPFPPEE